MVANTQGGSSLVNKRQTKGGNSSEEEEGGGSPLFKVLAAGAGTFAMGYRSGDPLRAAGNGALAGFGAAESIASAFPSLAGMANPIGIVGGAALGLVGAPLGRRKRADIRSPIELTKGWNS